MGFNRVTPTLKYRIEVWGLSGHEQVIRTLSKGTRAHCGPFRHLQVEWMDLGGVGGRPFENLALSRKGPDPPADQHNDVPSTGLSHTVRFHGCPRSTRRWLKLVPTHYLLTFWQRETLSREHSVRRGSPTASDIMKSTPWTR